MKYIFLNNYDEVRDSISLPSFSALVRLLKQEEKEE